MVKDERLLRKILSGRAGAKAKPYQVKQARAVIVRHGLGPED